MTSGRPRLPRFAALLLWAGVWALVPLRGTARAQAWSGQIAVELRGFFQAPAFPEHPRAINQTDLVENIDAENKLGQPMVNLNAIGATVTANCVT